MVLYNMAINHPSTYAIKLALLMQIHVYIAASANRFMLLNQFSKYTISGYMNYFIKSVLNTKL